MNHHPINSKYEGLNVASLSIIPSSPQFPIESNFVQHLSDNLNAEISLGTVTNVEEAVTWLSYTYLHVRMRKNPLVYGVNYAELRDDPELQGKRREIIVDAARSVLNQYWLDISIVCCRSDILGDLKKRN